MTLALPRPHPLRQYAFVADGERGALIGPDGAWVWLCFPGWHSPGVFTSLIGGAGFYRVGRGTRSPGVATTSLARSSGAVVG